MVDVFYECIYKIHKIVHRQIYYKISKFDCSEAIPICKIIQQNICQHIHWPQIMVYSII